MYQISLPTPLIPHALYTLLSNTDLVFKLFTPISTKDKKKYRELQII